MRELAHLASIILVIPSLLFASVFVALGHVNSQPGFLAFIYALLEVIAVLLPWLLFSFALLIALAMFGFSRRHRWSAAICVAGVAIACTGVLVWMGQAIADAGDAVFHLPAAIAVAISTWLAVTEWPASKSEA